MSAKLSPLFNDAQLDSSTGAPLAGGLVYWYLAGTTTPAAIYTDSAGLVHHTNPVVLNSRGEPASPIWLNESTTYKAVLADALNNTIRTVDNISGVNDVSAPVINEWVLYAPTASYIDATSFSVPGDATNALTVTRRIKAPVSGLDCYGTISTSTYALGETTVVMTIDGGNSLNAGLTNVYYGFLDPTYPSIDVIIPIGTPMLFMKESAPTGWTEDSTFAGRNLYIKDGSHAGASVGGSHNPLLMNVVPSHTHTFTTDNDTHSHTVAARETGVSSLFGSTGAGNNGIVSITSSSDTHAHTGTTANNGSASNWTPKYATAIVCTKN